MRTTGGRRARIGGADLAVVTVDRDAPAGAVGAAIRRAAGVVVVAGTRGDRVGAGALLAVIVRAGIAVAARLVAAFVDQPVTVLIGAIADLGDRRGRIAGRQHTVLAAGTLAGAGALRVLRLTAGRQRQVASARVAPAALGRHLATLLGLRTVDALHPDAPVAERALRGVVARAAAKPTDQDAVFAVRHAQRLARAQRAAAVGVGVARLADARVPRHADRRHIARAAGGQHARVILRTRLDAGQRAFLTGGAPHAKTRVAVARVCARLWGPRTGVEGAGVGLCSVGAVLIGLLTIGGRIHAKEGVGGTVK